MLVNSVLGRWRPVGLLGLLVSSWQMRDSISKDLDSILEDIPEVSSGLCMRACTHTHKYTCTYVYMHTHKYTCTHVYMHTPPQTIPRGFSMHKPIALCTVCVEEVTPEASWTSPDFPKKCISKQN